MIYHCQHPTELSNTVSLKPKSKVIRSYIWYLFTIADPLQHGAVNGDSIAGLLPWLFLHHLDCPWAEITQSTPRSRRKILHHTTQFSWTTGVYVCCFQTAKVFFEAHVRDVFHVQARCFNVTIAGTVTITQQLLLLPLIWALFSHFTLKISSTKSPVSFQRFLLNV